MSASHKIYGKMILQDSFDNFRGWFLVFLQCRLYSSSIPAILLRLLCSRVVRYIYKFYVTFSCFTQTKWRKQTQLFIKSYHMKRSITLACDIHRILHSPKIKNSNLKNPECTEFWPTTLKWLSCRNCLHYYTE